MKDNIGTSILITRSVLGEEMIQSALNDNAICVSNIEPKQVIKSQYHSLYNKKMGIRSRMDIMKLLGLRIPQYNINTYRSSKLLFLTNVFKVFNALIPKTNFGLKLLKSTPFPILRLYGAILYYLDRLSARVVGRDGIE